jgi:hypothetical protein
MSISNPRNPSINPTLAHAPDLTGIPVNIQRELEYLRSALYTLQNSVGSQPPPPIPPTYSQIRQSLQASGSNPLNVQSLLGTLSEPQIPNLTVYPGPPGPTAPTSQDGALVSIGGPYMPNGLLRRYNALTQSYQPVQTIGADIVDTAANLVKYPAASYDLGTHFFASDNGQEYIINLLGTTPTWVPLGQEVKFGLHGSRISAGQVNTAGTAVTITTGNPFNDTGLWAGGTIYINYIPYVIASVTNPASLTLTTSAGTQ